MKAVLMVAVLPGNREVVQQFLTQKGLACVTAGSANEVESQLAEKPGISVVVVDASGFRPDLLPVCQIILQRNIPLFWVLPAAGATGALAPPPGVAGIWRKPLSPKELLANVLPCLKT